jgi:hypothetical protein
MVYPLYRYPPFAFLRLAGPVLLGGRRSFQKDARDCLALLEPPLHLLGAEHIPASGPIMITFNHYYRPGFDAWWMALGLAAVVPLDIHFVMTGELTYPGMWYAPLGMAGSRWLLRRLSKIYGFTTMPPMPPRPKDFAARTRSVRKTLEFARQHPQAVLGLAPEGGDQPGGVLTLPVSGAGRFMLLLAGAGFKIVPVGAYETDGEFCLNFGMAYELVVPRGLLADEKDHTAAEIVIRRIAAQLPERLRGSFQ